MNTKLALLLTSILLTSILLVGPTRADEIFSEDFSTGYERGKLVAQNGWGEFKNTPSSPIVYDTEGRFGGSVGWAVTCKEKSSSDDWGIKTIPAPDLQPDDKLVVEIIGARQMHPDGAGNGVMFGFGSKIIDKAIGLSHLGVFFRDDWGRTVHAIGADGYEWNEFGSGDVIALRSVWDLKAGTASLAVRNVTAGESEYTPLYFDKGQTTTTVDLGSLAPLDTWSEVFVRTNGTKGALLFEAKVSRESSD